MASIIQSPRISPVSNDRRREIPANLRRSAKFKIISKVKEDAEAIRVWKMGGNMRLYWSLVKETTTSSEDEKRGNKHKYNNYYYANMGDAIRTLRHELPHLFNTELTYHIYRDDIVFKDPLNTFFGIQNYKSIFWALRFHGKVFFKTLWVHIVSVWQPVESTIMIRWTVHGIPRVPWDSRARFDATSEYKLDEDGKIFEHRVHNIALNAPPKFHVFNVNDLLQFIACPSTPKPTYFEIASLSSITNIKLREPTLSIFHFHGFGYNSSGNFTE